MRIDISLHIMRNSLTTINMEDKDMTTKLFANESELMEYRLDQIEKQLEIKNKLELLKMGYEAGIVTEEQ